MKPAVSTASLLLLASFAFGVQPAMAQNLLQQGGNLLGGALKPGSSNKATGAGLSDGEIGAGLKDALKIGAERTVATVGRPGGYLDDKAIHIPLPGALGQAQAALKLAGAGGLTDDLETKMNRAAEAAAPKAQGILVGAIQKMSISDARGILTGPKDAATQYFRRATTGDLTAAFKPIVDQTLSQVGAVKALNSVTSQVKSLPLAGSVNLDLTSYVVGKALDGIFLYLSKEEASIRDNPAQRSTELLKKVFGG
ncbi:MAG TPA: DUF4197 domain-containing protein [Stellaceae bacterium]|nr:DUF4197 domain-containing protein [Stellaceae bacterium]